jgi:filamentous hemagglutinin
MATMKNRARPSYSSRDSRTGQWWLSLLLVGVPVSQATAGPPLPPNLPTPCAAANCGSNAQSFVTYGAVSTPQLIGSTLTINQTSNKAILNWADFNIAKGFTVNFVQPSATAAVLNEIWSADPSVIAGGLHANGQVYLYNQNGIIFAGGAQVNVAGLTASTLALPANLFENGILSGGATTPVFQAAPGSTPGPVTVDAGASLTTADGGRIMLLGSAVTNEGTITTPDGQTILGAATKNVYLAASSDPSMRGLLIEVDGGGVSGTVTNGGTVSAPRGNITLAGLIVKQEGTLSATTSVSENGSIYLVAGDTSGSGSFSNPNPTQNGAATAFGGLLPNNGGTLLLEPGSVTEILPDPTDTATLNGAQRSQFIPSQVDLAGQAIAMSGNATIRAPGGSVNAYAASDPALLFLSPTTPPAPDTGSIYLDSSSVIDVSGLSNVAVPVTQNLLQVTLETNDLQDDPLLRGGFLHGATVTVDIRTPPSLFNIAPYVSNIGFGIDQVLTQAGSIQLNATGDVITRAGSTLNVSGGSVAFQGGSGPATTNLLGADGKVYNISTAPSTIQYVGFANSYSSTDPTWGVTTQGAQQAYYAGYTQGANAGSVTIESPLVYLRGNMLAATTNGLYQRSPSSLAAGGTLTLGCAGCVNDAKQPNFGLNGGVTLTDDIADTLNGNIVFDGAVISATDIPVVSLVSPTQLTRSGFSAINVFSTGPIQLAAGNNVALPADGSLTLKSGLSIDVAGNITGPGATVSLQTVNTDDGLPHDIVVEPGVGIDVSGSWINDSPAVTLVPGTTPTVINGGKVSLSAAGNLTLSTDTSIDVSGGAWVSQSGQISDGNAGSIALAATFSPLPGSLASSPYIGTLTLSPSTLLMGGSLSATGGGSISLQSGSITVGVTAAGTPGELLVTPDFFSGGGFASYALTGLNDLTIGNLKDTSGAAPIVIAPLEQRLVFTQNPLLEPTGTRLESFARLEALPLSERGAASVSFASNASDVSGVDIGDVTLAADAAIITDPGASVTLDSAGFNGSVRVFGRIDAPAGTINLILENQSTGIQSGNDPGFIPDQQILLGPAAVLSAPSFAKIDTLDQLGYPEGQVLAGGTVNLIANKGFIVTDPGSLINVSGTAGTIDLFGANGQVTPTLVAGRAGTVNLDAREGLVLQGTLLGEPAGLNGSALPNAAGGALNIDLGYGYDFGIVSGANLTAVQYPTSERVLTVVGVNLNGQPAAPPTNQLLSGSTFINMNTLNSGGFDNVSLQSADAIAFAGAVSLHPAASLVLDAPLFLGNGSQTSLSSAYVAIGNYSNAADYFSSANPTLASILNPQTGNGTLSVAAQLIDVRGITGYSGFASETFSSSGDLRFVAPENYINAPPAVGITGNPNFEGALITAAALNLQAAQLYPTTATPFAIQDLPAGTGSGATPLPTSVTLSSPAGATLPAVPLSAGGSLTISATAITQAGILRAPFGSLSLDGVSILAASGNTVVPGSVTLTSGSVTSVSGDGSVIPYGTTANGIQWTYSPSSAVTDIVTAPPAKQISLSGSSVTVSSGANVDLSGGGDLYAYEFVAGQGGSVDVLNPANAASHPSSTSVYTYAILPGLSSQFGAFDPQYAQGQVTTGQTITLSGVPGLPAGTYALLPARYALLPGAFAIDVVQSNSGIAAGSAIEQSNGSYVVAARFGLAGTAVEDSLTSTILVAPQSTVLSQSQYTNSYANTFFSSAAQQNQTATPALPADAGQLLLSATTSLSIAGTLNLARGSYVSGTDSNGKPIVQQGAGGDVAIAAQNLLIDDAPNAAVPAGTVQLSVQQLDNLDTQTLLLGGSLAATSAGEVLTPLSQTVELRNTTPLTAPEVLLAAQDSVILDPGASVGTGTAAAVSASSSAATLLMPGGGALLRVSSGPAIALGVDPTTLPTNPMGTVTIGAGANVQGSGSILLYGTNNTTLANGAVVAAPDLSLYSSEVSFGSAPTGTPGLVVTAQLLGQLKGLQNLTIGSSSSINFYGAVDLGGSGSGVANLASVSLDAPALAGYGGGDKVVQAGNIVLTNSSGGLAAFSNSPDGTGALALIATGSTGATGEIALGSGTKLANGFSSVQLQAGADIVVQGTGSLDFVGTSPVPVTMTSQAIIAGAAANQTIQTSGALTIAGNTATAGLTLPTPGFGARLAIQGSAITDTGTIDLPAGSISLSATQGDVTLGQGAAIRATGATQSYGGVTQAAAAGGAVVLSALAGNVTIEAGASVDVSGVSNGTAAAGAGTVTVSAPTGSFVLSGTLVGQAPLGQESGSFTLDVGSGLGGSNLTSLLANLATDGFAGAIDLRSRSDAAVTLDGNVKAASFQLAVDQGSIEVTGNGVIDTSGGSALDGNGGAIALWAGTGITIAGGAQLLANAGSAGPEGTNGTALAAHGGDITLGTVSGSIAVTSGTSAQPTVISMLGNGTGNDGTLTLRAPRTADNTNVQVVAPEGAYLNILSSNSVIVEGVRSYAATDLGSVDAGCGSGGSCDIADLNGVLFTDAASFAAATATPPANLAGLGIVQVRPGIEIDSGRTTISNGDLTLDGSTSAWDLASWNAALGTPLNITLRAAGNLVLQSSLSDGFTDTGGPVSTWSFGAPSGAGAGSASLRLVGGADLSAANPLAVIAQAPLASSLGAPPNTGNVIQAPGTLVRTGSGNIDVAAGGDVLLGYAFSGYDSSGNALVSESDPLSAVIYTAGVPSVLNADQSALFNYPGGSRLGANAVVGYPTDGGNVTVFAADDIRSAISAKFVTDWLWRRAPSNGTFAPKYNTSWWIMFNDFEQGIGALGGGDISLTAGRDIVNVSAVIPTTGRLLVASGDTPQLSDLLLTGGGNLRVSAGGDIYSGVYEDDWGNASITAGGTIGSSVDSTFGQQFPNPAGAGVFPAPSTEVYPLLVVGNGAFNVSGAGGVSLEGVATSTTLPASLTNVLAFNGAAVAVQNFYTYAEDANPSTLSISSSGGSVTLNTDALTNYPLVALLNADVAYPYSLLPSSYLATYPATLNVAALSGDIDLGNSTLAQSTGNTVSLTLFPAPSGNLTLLAQGSINNDGVPYQITMSESDPTLVGTVIAPVSPGTFLGVSGVPLPLTPLHQNDGAPISLVANTGNIGSGGLLFPKAANIIAGGNIADVDYTGKNLNPSDVTLIEAGGTISFSTPTLPITNTLIQNGEGIRVGGPGFVEVLAGGTIDLGDGTGVLTSGSLADSRLPAQGASILVGAGLGNSGSGLRQPDNQAFIASYLAPNPSTGAPSIYAANLTAFLQQLNPTTYAGLSYQAALSAFEALTPAQQLPLLASVLSDELSATGLAHTLNGTNYERGYQAIDTLFPTQDSLGNPLTYSGDLNMFYSQLKTEQGGDINLLVPGGSVIVGVPNPPANLATVKGTYTSNGQLVTGTVNLGILVLGEGAVEGFADQNFDVNQSRILTLEGGDIILWASNGNIDAGKGAKSASGAPPPVIQTDASGNLFVNPSNAVSGSGIGQLLTVSGIKAGLVNLIAPKGVVNAGDAGIRVAGNLNIAAVQVIGAGNITVAGTATGVPTSEAGAFAGALSGANALGDTSKNVTDQIANGIGAATNYQQLTQSLSPTFIVVKMFCLGIECETN